MDSSLGSRGPPSPGGGEEGDPLATLQPSSLSTPLDTLAKIFSPCHSPCRSRGQEGDPLHLPLELSSLEGGRGIPLSPTSQPPAVLGGAKRRTPSHTCHPSTLILAPPATIAKFSSTFQPPLQTWRGQEGDPPSHLELSSLSFPVHSLQNFPKGDPPLPQLSAPPAILGGARRGTSSHLELSSLSSPVQFSLGAPSTSQSPTAALGRGGAAIRENPLSILKHSSLATLAKFSWGSPSTSQPPLQTWGGKKGDPLPPFNSHPYPLPTTLAKFS